MSATLLIGEGYRLPRFVRASAGQKAEMLASPPKASANSAAAKVRNSLGAPSAAAQLQRGRGIFRKKTRPLFSSHSSWRDSPAV